METFKSQTAMKRVQYYSPDRVDGDLWVDVSGDLGGVHVGNVLEVSGEAVVLHDEGVEDVGEVDVAVLIAGVDPAVLQGEYSPCPIRRKDRQPICIPCIAY